MVKYRDKILNVLRWALGALFIFSGAVKCVDPIGTSIFVDKYLTTYSLEALLPLSVAIGLALSVMEFMLGTLLICSLWRRFISLVSVVVLVLFSVVTLLSATLLPIGDCGCFGEVLKLSPWATFLKNIILLAIALYVWHNSRNEWRLELREVIVLAFAIFLPLGANLYALSHLPLVDFLPYKVGTNLREAVAKEQDSVRSVLRFRNSATGDIEEFDAMATECWMRRDLEFLESAVVVDDKAQYSDFRLYDTAGEEYTQKLLNRRGRVALLCINDISALDILTQRAIETLCNAYPETAIYILSYTEVEDHILPLNATHLYIDAMTLRSIIRADIGVVILRDGVVEFKANIKDI